MRRQVWTVSLLPWPIITVSTPGHEHRLTPETGAPFYTEAVLQDWTTLLRGSYEVCLYAAFLQYLSDGANELPESLWVLGDLKTSIGYWSSASF